MKTLKIKLSIDKKNKKEIVKEITGFLQNNTNGFYTKLLISRTNRNENAVFSWNTYKKEKSGILVYNLMNNIEKHNEINKFSSSVIERHRKNKLKIILNPNTKIKKEEKITNGIEKVRGLDKIFKDSIKGVKHA